MVCIANSLPLNCSQNVFRLIVTAQLVACFYEPLLNTPVTNKWLVMISVNAKKRQKASADPKCLAKLELLSSNWWLRRFELPAKARKIYVLSREIKIRKYFKVIVRFPVCDMSIMLLSLHNSYSK